MTDDFKRFPNVEAMKEAYRKDKLFNTDPADALRAEVASLTKWLHRATDLLSESLSKWEDEEESVQEEKADHIADLNKFFDEYNKRSK